MPGLISNATGYTTNFDAGVPTLSDQANIVDAFKYYHYGPSYNGTGTVGGIEGHLQDISNTVSNLLSDTGSSLTISPASLVSNTQKTISSKVYSANFDINSNGSQSKILSTVTNATDNIYSYVEIYPGQVYISSTNNTDDAFIGTWEMGNVEVSGSGTTIIGRSSSITQLNASNFFINGVSKELGLPQQSTHSGKFLTTDGTSASWSNTLSQPVIDNPRLGYTTTATSAGTLTLTATSSMQQFFTGTSTHTLVLPVTSTLALGQMYVVHNNSTGAVTVQSSGLNNIYTIPAGVTVQFTCISTTLTTAAAWDFDIAGATSISGTGGIVFASSPTITTPTIDTINAATATTAVSLYPNVTTSTGSISIGAGLTTGSLNLASVGTGATPINIGHTNATTTFIGNVLLPTATTKVGQTFLLQGGAVNITFPTIAGTLVGSGDTETITTAMLASSTSTATGVTYAKMQFVSAQYRLLGRITAAAGVVEELTPDNLVTTLGQATVTTARQGTGAIVLATSPTLTTPVLGVATATSINKVAITAPATSATLTIADGKTLTVSNTLTFTGTDASSVAFGTGGTVAYTGGNLAQFAATTSAQLAGVISDETGFSTGAALVFSISPALTGTPTAPTAAVDTNTTQIATTAYVVGQGYLKESTAATTYAAIEDFIVIEVTPDGTAVSGTSQYTFRAPFAMTLTQIPRAFVSVASSSGDVQLDITANSSTIFSTQLSIDATEKTSTTATTAAVLSTTSISNDAELIFDVVQAGTGAEGLKVILYYKRA